jgi:DNA-binding transcriptional regulator YhcF (GntR family)
MLTTSFVCRKKGTARAVLDICWVHTFNGDRIPKRNGNPMKVKDFAIMLGVSLPTIYNAIKFLVEKGFIVKEGRIVKLVSQKDVIKIYNPNWNPDGNMEKIDKVESAKEVENTFKNNINNVKDINDNKTQKVKEEVFEDDVDRWKKYGFSKPQKTMANVTRMTPEMRKVMSAGANITGLNYKKIKERPDGLSYEPLKLEDVEEDQKDEFAVYLDLCDQAT